MHFVFYGQNKYCSRLPFPPFLFNKIRVSLCEQYYFLTKNQYYLNTVKQNIENAKALNALNVDRGRALSMLINGCTEEEKVKICKKHLQFNNNLEELLERINIKIDYILREKTKPLFDNNDDAKAGGGPFDDIVGLSMYLGFRVPPSIPIVEYIAYLNFSQQRIKEENNGRQNRG